MNLRFAKSFGITNFLEENAAERLKVLEVGTGYGSLMHFIETHTNHQYTGVDVVARVPGVIEATAEGLIPEELVKSGEGHVQLRGFDERLSAPFRPATRSLLRRRTPALVAGWSIHLQPERGHRQTRALARR